MFIQYAKYQIVGCISNKFDGRNEILLAASSLKRFARFQFNATFLGKSAAQAATLKHFVSRSRNAIATVHGFRALAFLGETSAATTAKPLLSDDSAIDEQESEDERHVEERCGHESNGGLPRPLSTVADGVTDENDSKDGRPGNINGAGHSKGGR